jgi:dTDP-glucose 4,6-dehydratase
VTGAGGFIGSHLVEALTRDGWAVRAMVHYNSRSSAGWLDDVSELAAEVVAGDVRDGAFVREAMRGCDVVMHLAALIGIPYSYVAPGQYVETNIVGTLNVLQAARDHGVRKVIQTSTSEVYGTAQFVPITESHPVVGQSPYSASKIGADQLAISFFRSFGLPVTILRPFNTYGPRQSRRAVIPTIVTQLLAGQKRIELGALTPTRDLTFVTDTARAFIQAARSDQGVGEIVNVGSNFEISVGDLVSLIAEVVDVQVEVEQKSERLRPASSEVERLWADAGKARAMIGWHPEIGGRDGLKAGLAKTIAWFRARGPVADAASYAV